MISRYLLPGLGVIGLCFGIVFAFTYGKGNHPEPNQLSLPPSAPYESTISGTGIIEANSRNIDIGSHLSGVVASVAVGEGQLVKKGDALFALDNRAASAEVETRKKDVATASARLESAKIQLADDTDQLKRAESLKVGIAVSQDALTRRRFAVQKASANITQSQAELESAKAMLNSAQVTLDRMTARAPIDGRILKVNIRPGEFVTAGSAQKAVLMGNDTPLYVRVTIDENDVWRYLPESKAEGALRSNKDIKVPLKFVRIDPYVQPKRNLTGDSSELVDTRVLEAVYEVEGDTSHLFIGQQMDIFIEAPQR